MSHVRADVPNQDAVGWFPESGPSPVRVVCVADGHGSRKCFRSHVGSRLAVEAGIEVGRRFLEEVGGADSVAAVLGRAQGELPAAIVAAWRARVADELARAPLTEEELASVGEEVAALEGTPELAYGATLLAALFGPGWVVVVQVGDGDVLFVSPSGETARPVPKDARLIGNETTSLSAPDAPDDFRVAVTPVGPDGPVLVIVATDGFANAYADDTSFLKVGSDVLTKVQADGMEGVEAELETWLSSASSYDGDDVSAVIVSLADSGDHPAPLPPVRGTSARTRGVGPALAVAAGLLVIVGGVVAYLVTRSSDGARPVLLSTADGSVVVSVTSGQAEPARRMERAPSTPPVSRLESGGVTWEVGPDGQVRGVQPGRGVVAVVPLPERVASIGMGGRWLWALAEAGDLVFRVDVATGRCVAAFAVKRESSGGNAAGSIEPARMCQG